MSIFDLTGASSAIVSGRDLRERLCGQCPSGGVVYKILFVRYWGCEFDCKAIIRCYERCGRGWGQLVLNIQFTVDGRGARRSTDIL
jgi:hypothetical protein